MDKVLTNLAKGNNLIAESPFSGLLALHTERPDIITKPLYQIGVWKPEYEGVNGIYHSPLDRQYAVVDTVPSYHSSWEWLMPIVERIEKEGYDVYIVKDRCIIQTANNVAPAFWKVTLGDNKIHAVWRAVIRFITKTEEGAELP